MSYRIHITKNLLIVSTFLILCLIVGVYTFVLYGDKVAFYGLIRFVNVALIAPLACVLFHDSKQVKVFVLIWIFIVVLGAVTALLQFIGIDMSWLVKDYIAMREGKIRFMTILGEPNIGGMASVILCAFLINYNSWPLIKIFLITSTILLFLLSVSKAAIAGLILLLIIFIFDKVRFSKYFYIRLSFKKLTFSMIIVMLILGTIIIIDEEKINEFLDYTYTAINAFCGSDSDNNSIIKDLEYRVHSKVIEGIKVAQEQSIFNSYFMNVIIGSSYGIAGSSAQELRGSRNAILPHNGFLEIYLVGGLLMLFIFMLLCLNTLIKLLVFSRNNSAYSSLLFVFVLLLAFMFTYPIIYQPVLGAMFWLIIGLTGSPFLNLRKIV